MRQSSAILPLLLPGLLLLCVVTAVNAGDAHRGMRAEHVSSRSASKTVSHSRTSTRSTSLSPSATRTLSPTPSTSAIVACGPAAGGASCVGGRCCSVSGLCGTSDAFCAQGLCLPEFGYCPSPAATPTPAATTASITGYGYYDNCPPSAALAYHVLHAQAGGTGTYADPISYAGAVAATPPGTIIYIPSLQKYFIMEDLCLECTRNWKSHELHFDLWMGPSVLVPGIAAALTSCEVAISSANVPVIINAPDGLAVDTTPLFDGSNCIVPSQQCVDMGNKCGNRCKIPATATCAQLAQLFGLTLARFEQLNPQLRCNTPVRVNTVVCQGGSCGG